MANVWKDLVRVSVTVADKSASSVVQVYANPTLPSLENIKQWSEDVAGAVQALTKGKIESVEATLIMTITGQDEPTVDVDVEEKGLFLLNAGDYKTRTSIPAFDETKLQADGVQIDQADSDVEAFTTLLTDGKDYTIGIGGVYEPCNERGDDITSVRDAYKIHTRSHKIRGSRRG